MDNELQIEQAKKCLQALESRLKEIDKIKEKRINVFEATGMRTQEIKHSAFLAWLLDPNKPHGAGSGFLERFLKSVDEYRSDDVTVNKNIIENSLCNIRDILDDKNIEVYTEKVLVDIDNRIDIFIASPKARTVIVIENKVFAGERGDQLSEYVEQVKKHSEYSKYKSVFIYLTPKGIRPYKEEDRRNWCIFDYGGILRIVKDLYSAPTRDKENAKLKLLLEDYMELVQTKILQGNSELRALCLEIYKEHEDAIKILRNFTYNAKDVVEYCLRRFKIRFDCEVFRCGETSFEFYLRKVKKYFESRGEKFIGDGESFDDGVCKCRFGVSAVDGSIVFFGCIEKAPDAEWSPAQESLMSIAAPNKKRGNRYFTFIKDVLVSQDELGFEFDDVIKKLDEKLSQSESKLAQFENSLQV